MIIPQYQMTSHTLVEDFEDYTEWTKVSGVDPVEDAVNFVTGTKSVRLTNTGAASIMRKEVDFTLTNTGHISIDIYYHSGTSPSFRLFLYDDTVLLNHYIWTVLWLAPGIPVGWYHFDIMPSEMTLHLSTWTTPVKAIQIDCQGADTDASFDAIYKDVVTTGTPAVVFRFDDGLVTNYTQVYPIFTSRNAKAVVYIISDRLGTDDYMTSSQLLELYNAGWIIGNHTKSHTNLTGKSQAEVETAISGCETALAALGISPTRNKHFAYPFGVHSDAAHAALIAQGFKTAQGLTNSLPPQNFYNNMDLFYLWAFELSNLLSLENAKAYIATAKAANKVAFFYGHDIGDAAGVGTWAADDLAALMDYAIAESVPIITIDDYYNLYSQDVGGQSGQAATAGRKGFIITFPEDAPRLSSGKAARSILARRLGQ